MTSSVDSFASMAASCERGTGHLPPLPTDLYKHVMLAGLFSSHARDLGGFAFPKRSRRVRGYTPRPEREIDFAFQIVIPAHCLLFRTGIDDRFVLDAVFPPRISLGSFS